MEYLKELMPIIIYGLLIVILIVGIVLGIKVLLTMKKVDGIIDDLNHKVKSLDGIFNFIDHATAKVTTITDRLADGISLGISKMFFSRKKKKNQEEDY